MENVAIKGRGGNDVQHKNSIIRHCGLGHEVQESWPYLSNATLGPYELSHVKTGGGTPHMKGVGMLV